jgi:hypothetical protein
VYCAVAGALAFNTLVWAVSAAPVGALLARWGPRRLFAAGALVAGLVLAVAAFAREPWQLYLGVGLLAGVGFTPLVLGSQGVVHGRSGVGLVHYQAGGESPGS